MIKKTKSQYLISIFFALSAAGLGLLMVPILGNLYSPEQVGLYAVYISIAAIASKIATLQLEYRFGLEDNFCSNVQHLRVHLTILLIVTFFIGIPAFYFLRDALSMNGVLGCLLSVLMTLAAGMRLNFVYYLVAEKKIASMGAVKFFAALIALCAVGIYGYFAANHYIEVPLLISAVFLLGMFVFLFLVKGGFRQSISIDLLIGYMSKNWRFVRYKVSQATLNELGRQLPIFFILAQFGAKHLAYYYIANRIVSASYNILSDTARPLLHRQFSVFKTSKNIDRLRRLLLWSVLAFGVVAIFYSFVILFVLPVILPFLVRGWGEEVLSFLVPLLLWYGTKFSVSPNATIMSVLGKENIAFWVVALFFIFRLSYTILWVGNDAVAYVWGYSIISFCFYVAYMASMFLSVRKFN